MGRGQYIKQGTNPAKNTWLVVTPLKDDGPGALAAILDVFKANKVNLSHIESRTSHRSDQGYEFLVECDDKVRRFTCRNHPDIKKFFTISLFETVSLKNNK